MSLRHLPEGAKTRFGKGIIYQVQFSPNSNVLAVASSIGIWIYDTETYQEIALLTKYTDAVTSFAFSPDGTALAGSGGGGDNTIRLWDAAIGQQLKILVGHTAFVSSVAFSPDGLILASGSGDNTIRLWDIVTGKQLETFAGHTASVQSVFFCPDSAMLVSGSEDGTVLLWNLTIDEAKRNLQQ